MICDSVELVDATIIAQDLLPAMLDQGRQWEMIDGVLGGLLPNIPDIFPTAPYVCLNVWEQRWKSLCNEENLARTMGAIFSCCYSGIASVLLWCKRPGARNAQEMLDELLVAYQIDDFDYSILRCMGITIGSREHGDFNLLMSAMVSTGKERFARAPDKFKLMCKGAGIALSWFGMAYMIHKLGIKGVNC